MIQTAMTKYHIERNALRVIQLRAGFIIHLYNGRRTLFENQQGGHLHCSCGKKTQDRPKAISSIQNTEPNLQ